MTKLIEFVAITVILLITGKGLLFGLILGTNVAIGKIIYNTFRDPEKKLSAPFLSIGIGALSGFAALFIGLIF